MKRKIIIDIAISWLLFIGLYALIIIGQNLGAPWNRITNGLWLVGAVALVFFLGRGMYRLLKYQRDNKR